MGNHVAKRFGKEGFRVGAANIELTDEEYATLTTALDKIEIHGDRDGKDIAKLGTVPDNVDR